MWRSSLRRQLLVAILVEFVTGYNSANYADLEVLGVNCPERDKCHGYRNHLTYEERSCECDYKCTAYKDCCIDAWPSRAEQTSRPPPRTDVECLHYGENEHTGVFAISRCSSSWTGSEQIREMCEGPTNFSDPLITAAPVTDVSRNETYRNLACAECNYANLTSLRTFQLKMCQGLSHLVEEEIMGDLTYNESLDIWGVMRLNRIQRTEFFECNIIFDVPGYLNNSVRFCRANLISTCASNWNRPSIARLCASYTAEIYTNTEGYRNPHCALCNHKYLDELSCRTEIIGRKRRLPFALLLDVNPTDFVEVGIRQLPTPACPAANKYDPFFKKCRPLMCALPDHVVENGRCAIRNR